MEGSISKLPALVRESWSSSHNRAERHFFIPEGNVGYQHNTYVFGYNPEVVPEALADKIVRMIKQELGLCDS